MPSILKKNNQFNKEPLTAVIPTNNTIEKFINLHSFKIPTDINLKLFIKSIL
jgi:hypothetical protein